MLSQSQGEGCLRNARSTNLFRMSVLSAVFAAGLTMFAGSASAAPQAVTLTPAAPPVLPTVLYQLTYAVSDHRGTTQPTGSGVSAETVVSLGLPLGFTASCRAQVQWIEWNGTIAGYSGPAQLVPGATLEFTTVNDPAVITTPYIANVFSNIVSPRTFEGHARIRVDCPVSGLRVNAAYLTDIVPSSTGTPSRAVKRHEIKVVRRTGNTGD
jgi:hypothetical protein